MDVQFGGGAVEVLDVGRELREGVNTILLLAPVELVKPIVPCVDEPVARHTIPPARRFGVLKGSRTQRGELEQLLKVL